ncbi:MAG: DUF5678 domain-containing protein [Candidatus Micrarchaeaceae archaeon]
MQSITQSLYTFGAAEKWIAEQHKSLVAKYNNQWIAVLNKSVVDHGKDIKKMKARLQEKYKEKYEQVVIDFVSKYTVDNMILAV